MLNMPFWVGIVFIIGMVIGELLCCGLPALRWTLIGRQNLTEAFAWRRKARGTALAASAAEPGNGLAACPGRDERSRGPMMWERFFNWQSDMDWAWGPLLPLRPSRATVMRPWVWVRLFLAFTALGLLLLALLVLVCFLLPRLAAVEHWSLPPLVSETLSTLQALGADPGARAELMGLLLSLPLLFFTFCLPYHWAWNRRAMRLREQGERTPEADDAGVEVWPPAIRTHPAASGDPPETGG